MRQILLWAFVILLVTIPSCCTVQPHSFAASKGVIVTALCPDLVSGTNAWRTDVASMYPDALVIGVHGGMQDGMWCAFPTLGGPIPVVVLVKLYHLYYPGRHIVLICCNPGHIVLHHVRNVSYALDDVWVMPDDHVGVGLVFFRDRLNPSYYGEIHEFVNLGPGLPDAFPPNQTPPKAPRSVRPTTQP